jgi:hypothetical protein
MGQREDWDIKGDFTGSMVEAPISDRGCSKTKSLLLPVKRWADSLMELLLPKAALW